MEQQKKRGGRAILAAGAAIQLLTGFPAAWGVFRQPVMEGYGLDGGQAAFAANCIVGAFGLGCVAGGWIQDRKSPKFAALLGSLLLCAGLFVSALAPVSGAGGFYLSFSLPVGLGCAFLYPAVMSCAQRWYAHRPGLATGVVGAGMGLSGLVLTLAVRVLVSRWGIRGCFLALGLVLLPLCGGCSLLLKVPKPPEKPADGLRPGEMLRTRAFWLVFLSVGLAAPSLLLFGPRIPELALERGLPEGAAAWLAAAGSAAAAAGRVSMAAAADRLGRRRTDLLLFAALTALSLAFAFAGGWRMAGVYLLLCFCYAGQSAVLPSLCSGLFGLAHTGFNCGWLTLGGSLGSIGFPLLARALGLEAGRHFMAAGAALIGLGCLWALEEPGQQKKQG